MPKSKPPQKKPSSSKPPPKSTVPLRPSPSSSSSSPSPSSLPLPLQSQILSTFRTALYPSSSSTSPQDLKSTIQEVKSHLYARDFASAFGRAEYLHAYALRWSAGRALGYASIFASGELRGIFDGEGEGEFGQGKGKEGGEARRRRMKRIVCIGGGAGAEVVALAAVHQYLDDPGLAFDVHAVDVADWSGVIEKLEGAWNTTSSSRVQNPHPQSEAVMQEGQRAEESEESDPSQQPATTEAQPSHATPSAAAESSHHHATFQKADILTLPRTPTLQSLFTPSRGTSLIITLLFTLNELFTTSLSQTTHLLLSLTDLTPPGTVLIVIDSPGSYSEVSVGANEGPKKRYPMRFLLDHTLMSVASEGGKWEKFVGEEARWFRIDEGLKGIDGGMGYPVELENMRYQIHGYRHL